MKYFYLTLGCLGVLLILFGSVAGAKLDGVWDVVASGSMLSGVGFMVYGFLKAYL